MTSIIRVKVYVRGKHGFHLGNLEPFWFLAGIGSSIFRLSMAIVDVTTVHDQRSLLRRIEGHYRLVYDQGIACDDLGTLGRRIPLLPFESSGLFFFQFPHVFHVLPLAGLFFQFRLADVTFHDRTCPGGRMSGGPGAFAFVELVIPSWRWTLLLLSLLLLYIGIGNGVTCIIRFNAVAIAIAIAIAIVQTAEKKTIGQFIRHRNGAF
mmetsp:Transcript_40727/g.85273  ORF Transcript_40727/g.85273 Transcript_40727/m.85273 type:complete len:207 (+) Transcript_40727:823-1443(+)